jgi:hypothetical protein
VIEQYVRLMFRFDKHERPGWAQLKPEVVAIEDAQKKKVVLDLAVQAASPRRSSGCSGWIARSICFRP